MACIRWAAPALAALLAFSAHAAGTAPGRGDHSPGSRDSYVLSGGEHWSIAGGSLENVRAAKRRWRGDFLWASRKGRELLIRDPRLLEEAAALFEPLRETEPEQKDLERAQRDLESRRNAVEREQEDVEAGLDRLADDGDSRNSERAGGDRRSLEDRRRRLEDRTRALDAEERGLDARERAIDDRNDALERKAEASLWLLIDRAASEGRAEDVRPR